MPYKAGLSDLLINIGQNTKRIRTSKYITQQELADNCDIDKSRISRIENLDYSNITIMSLVRLSIGLGCKIDELIEKSNM